MFTIEQINRFSELEIMIYNFIIEHPKDVANMSIQELANHTHVSTTTILRFCRSLGYTGYSEFKLQLSYSQNNKELVSLHSFYQDMSFLNKYTESDFQKKIEEAATILQQSTGIIWLGFGASAGICKYAANYFANTGKINLVIDDPYFHSKVPLFSGATLVVLSVSGEIDNTIRILQPLKAKDITVLSITNYDQSTLSKISDYVLPYYITYNKNNEIDMTTQLPVMLIIEMLGNKLMEQKAH
ncbi:MurR/RpiR family transcriptional regulator [Enterococcus sp. RIT-PI-f]|uniref:MurR/RpiR family transcriptional regulator n=1 Tax=Enterococcus sp. RIT-PI-f TaxID=1690244 RepID=UPI0006B9D913|nr:MurR/RpiR family transcriptional regulator [Enterococcus sp. RIT-PI-f]KPG74193.1 hypothetical protein AEQ18_00030 [Enterococcus sp. RIT-PI-f]